MEGIIFGGLWEINIAVFKEVRVEEGHSSFQIQCIMYIKLLNFVLLLDIFHSHESW